MSLRRDTCTIALGSVICSSQAWRRPEGLSAHVWPHHSVFVSSVQDWHTQHRLHPGKLEDRHIWLWWLEIRVVASGTGEGASEDECSRQSYHPLFG